MDSTLLFSFFILSLALAIGINYGFDRIYKKEFVNNLKDYKIKLNKSLLFSLGSLGSKSLRNFKMIEFESEINEFTKKWDYYNKEVKEKYQDLLTNRKNLLLLFYIASFIYFISLISPNLLIFKEEISSYGHIFFAIGLISLFTFINQLNSLKKDMANYELNNPLEESKQNIINNLSKNKKD